MTTTVKIQPAYYPAPTVVPAFLPDEIRGNLGYYNRERKFVRFVLTLEQLEEFVRAFWGDEKYFPDFTSLDFELLNQWDTDFNNREDEQHCSSYCDGKTWAYSSTSNTVICLNAFAGAIVYIPAGRIGGNHWRCIAGILGHNPEYELEDWADKH